MPCNPKTSLAEAAVCTLIKEIFAAFEKRRRSKRRRSQCEACKARALAVTP